MKCQGIGVCIAFRQFNVGSLQVAQSQLLDSTFSIMGALMAKESLAGISDDPSTGGPYVMWKDTDYAHIMVPVE